MLKINMLRVFKKLAFRCEEMIKRNITSNRFSNETSYGKPLKPVTIAIKKRKGSSYPNRALFDEGLLYHGITSRSQKRYATIYSTGRDRVQKHIFKARNLFAPEQPGLKGETLDNSITVIAGALIFKDANDMIKEMVAKTNKETNK